MGALARARVGAGAGAFARDDYTWRYRAWGGRGGAGGAGLEKAPARVAQKRFYLLIYYIFQCFMRNWVRFVKNIVFERAAIAFDHSKGMIAGRSA